MIVKNSKFRKDKKTIVICVCDKCGKKKEQPLQSVKRGRKLRGKDIDLCSSCSCTREYRKTIRGKKHHSWKHGLGGGYKRITLEDGRRMREHRYIYEKYIGRELKKEERVHHIDFDKLNNDIDNLVLFKNSREHRKCHMESMEKCALDFLNLKVWFNFKINKYILEYDKNCKRKKILLDRFHLTERRRKHEGIFYKYVDIDGNKRWKKACVAIAEKLLNRKLYYGEISHHIDGDDLNNDLNNLIVLTRKEHINAHYSLQVCTSKLLKMGFVDFNKEKKEYFIVGK